MEDRPHKPPARDFPGGPRLLTAQEQPLGLLDHPEQVFDGYVLYKACVLLVEEDARAHAVVVADHNPGEDTNLLPYLRSIIAAHDHVGSKRRRLLIYSRQHNR